MALEDLDCPNCGTDEHVVLVETLTGSQRRLNCEQCGATWLRGEPAPRNKTLPTREQLKKRFPAPGDVDPALLERAAALKATYLQTVPMPEANVAPYWSHYQQIFSADGLAHVDPQELKDFANSNVGANPGNMSVFNDAWNTMGPVAGASRTREVIDYLLRGPGTVPLEDRLTRLIDETTGAGMTGFKEALLTKVLCIVEPDRYLTILKYTGTAGKREIARAVWGLELPDPQKVTWTIGRLIIWSNDLLLALIGTGFTTQQHAADFLWWAKDQPRTTETRPT